MATLSVPEWRPIPNAHASDQAALIDAARGCEEWDPDARWRFVRDRLGGALTTYEADRILAGLSPVSAVETVVPFVGMVPWRKQLETLDHPMAEWLLSLPSRNVERLIEMSPPRPYADDEYAIVEWNSHAAVLPRGHQDLRPARSVAAAGSFGPFLRTERLVLGDTDTLHGVLDVSAQANDHEFVALFESEIPLRFANVPFDLDMRCDRDRYQLALELECHRLRMKTRRIASVVAGIEPYTLPSLY